MPATTPPAAPVAVGLATKTGLLTGAVYAVGGVANLVAGGPLEATVSGIGGGFGLLLTVLLGRYWQAAKVPHSVESVAKILDSLLESRLHLEDPAQAPRIPTGR